MRREFESKPMFQQRCRGPFASTKHLVWTFLRLSLRMVPKSFSATWCVRRTLYQLCIPILDKTAGTVAKCIAERWIQYSGPPMLIIADQGKKFVGTQFKEFTNANSILLRNNHGKMVGQSDTVTFTKGFSSALVGCTPRAVLWRFQHLAIQCCQESTVQPFRLLSSPASVRDWTPSSRGLDQ